MKIKDFITELKYSLTYTEHLKITLDSYDVNLIVEDESPMTVYITDFDNNEHLIAILYADYEYKDDIFSTWCENEIVRGHIIEHFNPEVHTI